MAHSLPAATGFALLPVRLGACQLAAPLAELALIGVLGAGLGAPGAENGVLAKAKKAFNKLSKGVESR